MLKQIAVLLCLVQVSTCEGFFNGKKPGSFVNKNRGGNFNGGRSGGGRGPGDFDGLVPRGGGDGEKGGLWNAYLGVLESKPLITKSFTSFFGFLIGDILTQLFIDKKDTYDFVRTLRMASFGLLIHGPTGHWFYGKLDGAIPGTGAVQVFSKVGIDQVLWNPIFGVMVILPLFFFFFIFFLGGGGLVGNVLLFQWTNCLMLFHFSS